MLSLDGVLDPQTLRQRLENTGLIRLSAFIGGVWSSSSDISSGFWVDNPADGCPLYEVMDHGPGAACAAVDSAALALSTWRRSLPAERARLLSALHGLVLSHADDLALIMSAEQGKPLPEAKGEVAYAASFLDWYAAEARRLSGEIPSLPTRGRELLVYREPIGVVAVVTPWNFPLAMLTRKLGPALAAGCTAVVKPAEATPLTAMALMVLAERAGIPPGVLNLVPASADQTPRVVQAWCDDPRVRKISFTGSTAVGRLLYAQSAQTVKRLSLELGGNAPFLVFEDADLSLAVEALIGAKLRNAGQTCVCPNRILVAESVAAEFIRLLLARLSEVSVGPGLAASPSTAAAHLGPLITDEAKRKVLDHVQDALDLGAELVFGLPDHPLGGRFLGPLVLDRVLPHMRAAQEETFGPLFSIMRFSEEAAGVSLANDTPFGLAAYFFSRDLARVFRVSRALEAGMVVVNGGQFTNEVAPFGGVKQSGLGREGSVHGIEEYLELKAVTLAGLY